MAGFSESALDKRLNELNGSAQSIQTVSLWLIHHRKHYSTIVKAWQTKVIEAPDSSRKLVFVYLANDVIQTSRKKGTEFGTEFQKVLVPVYKHLSIYKGDEKLFKSLNKVVNVWEQRHVYSSAFIQELRNALDASDSDASLEPVTKKPRESREKRHSETEVIERPDGTKEIHLTLSPRIPPSDPPETDELLKALQDLENAASCDAAVRERISKLPPEISEVKSVEDLTDPVMMQKFITQVNEAMLLLSEYNKRLSEEMDERRNVSRMLKDYLLSQEELLDQAQQRLEEYQGKLQKIYQVRKELENHLNNLPDLTRLPTSKNPLPSAGDLFKR